MLLCLYEVDELSVFVFYRVGSEVAASVSANELLVLELFLEERTLVAKSQAGHLAIESEGPSLSQAHGSHGFEVGLGFWL